MRRILKSIVTPILSALRSAWQTAFPPPDGPDTPPTIARAAALRDAAILSKDVDAVSKKRIA
jgi:hypothetical protein